MDLVCGVFQPELMPDWFSKVGPAIAAFVAVGVFVVSRWYARGDLRAKRRVLRVMLVEHIKDALYFAEAMRDEFKLPALPEFTSHAPNWAQRGIYEMAGSDRLFELQGDLVAVADHGDETVAEFIEACRRFRRRIDELARIERCPLEEGELGGKLKWVHDKVVERGIERAAQAIDELRRTGKAALAHLERLVPTTKFA
jgi:hypothetical protein